MKYVIRGENIKITKAIREYMITKLDRLDKYFDKPEEAEAKVLAKVKNNCDCLEVTINTKNFTIRCEEKTEDLYKSIDKSIDVLERQIKKNKTRIASKIRKQQLSEIILPETTEEDEEVEDHIVKRKKFDSKPMNEEEAILEMNLLKHDFFVFKDAETFEFKVLYRRKDGNYGIIETI